MNLPFFNKDILIVFLTIYIVVGVLGYIISFYRGNKAIISVSLALVFGAVMHYYFKQSFFSILLPFGFAPALIVGFLIGLSKYEPDAEPIKDVVIKVKSKKIYIRNVFAGVGIFGASRSGKTASVIYSLLIHFAKWEFSGLIYDYKNGELTEICLPLFGERVKIFAIHRPDISVRINPIHPKYLDDEKNVTSITKVLLDNLDGTEKGGNNFFNETAGSLLSALILKFSLHHQHFCTLPHVIAFILSVDFALKKEEENIKKRGLQEDAYDTFLGLKNFLIDDKRVKIQASSFILGLASEKQTAGVISTLANALRKISFPESFYALSGNDIDLNLNSKENKIVLSILNEPKDEDALTPFLAMTIQSITTQMMVRVQEPAFILLDEAPTIKLKKMARIASTMASFKIATIYCAQDISQAVEQYTRDGFKSILANLSTLFFGRANDPETGSFYEKYFEPKIIKTHSKTKGQSSSTTVGEREVAKVRAHEFTKFTPGKFAFISGGKTEVVQFKKYDIKETPLPNKYNLKNKMIANYEEIIDEVNLFAEKIGISSDRKL